MTAQIHLWNRDTVTNMWQVFGKAKVLKNKKHGVTCIFSHVLLLWNHLRGAQSVHIGFFLILQLYILWFVRCVSLFEYPVLYLFLWLQPLLNITCMILSLIPSCQFALPTFQVTWSSPAYTPVPYSPDQLPQYICSIQSFCFSRQLFIN